MNLTHTSLGKLVLRFSCRIARYSKFTNKNCKTEKMCKFLMKNCILLHTVNVKNYKNLIFVFFLCEIKCTNMEKLTLYRIYGTRVDVCVHYTDTPPRKLIIRIVFPQIFLHYSIIFDQVNPLQSVHDCKYCYNH